MNDINENNIVSIKNLTKKYGVVEALKNIDLDIPRNAIVGLLGPNGSGKTTMIKVLVGLLNQYEGSVIIDGKELGQETKKLVSYLPDRDYLSNAWTFNDAVEYFKDFYDDFDVEKANRLIDELKIPRNVRFKALSKGTREKLQLILVLSRNAKLYIFDEPIAGVDPVARDLVFKLITENRAEDSTVIISTHLIMDCEQYLDYVVFIKEGQIVLRNDANKLRESTGKSINDVFKELFRYDR
ncbi:MAG: ABC transporter ATP-binding protein [Bacilli bacterium]|nr:ABC transporter ATP-binding protein [Bacilli bacterium]